MHKGTDGPGWDKQNLVLDKSWIASGQTLDD